MIPHPQPATVLLAIALGSATAATADPISPGRWQTTSITAEGETQHGAICILPEQAAQGVFMLGNRPDGCEAPANTLADGRIGFVLRCQTEAGTMTSETEGQYDATTLNMTVKVTTGADAPMRGTTEGRYEGPQCQPDDVRYTFD